MRPISVQLEAYGVSVSRYRELEYFCYQYQEKRKAAHRLLRQSGGQAYAIASGGDALSDPTAAAAARREALLEDCADIENAAAHAVGGSRDPVMYKHLLRYVTVRDKPPIDTIPCGRRQFYELRRRFFGILHLCRQEKGL